MGRRPAFDLSQAACGPKHGRQGPERVPLRDTGSSAEGLIMRAAAPRDPAHLMTPNIRADRSEARWQVPLSHEARRDCRRQAIKALAPVQGKRIAVAFLCEVFEDAGGGAKDGKPPSRTNVVGMCLSIHLRKPSVCNQADAHSRQ